jgi:hypothetical protein
VPVFDALAADLDSTRYPTRGQFAAARLSGLVTAVERRLGGHRAMAASLGLEYPRGAWTKAEAERAVRALAGQRGGKYPTPREFHAHGLTGAFLAVTQRFGGHDTFARSLGMPRSRVQGRTREEAQEAVLVLSASCSANGRYPESEFVAADKGALYGWIRVQPGGHHAVAAEIGLKLTREAWTRERAESAIRAVVDELHLGTLYPSSAQMKAAGLRGLEAAIGTRFGGRRSLATQMGLRIPTRHHSVKWTEEAATQRTRDLAMSLGLPDRYPTMREFNAAGLGGLAVAIRCRLGGHAHLAARAGLKRTAGAQR